MRTPFKIKTPIGASYALDEDDVLKTKSALTRLGYYKNQAQKPSPWPDARMFAGLKSFQEDAGLSSDGVMKPNGPTEKALSQSLATGTVTNPTRDGLPNPSPPKEDRCAHLSQALIAANNNYQAASKRWDEENDAFNTARKKIEDAEAVKESEYKKRALFAGKAVKGYQAYRKSGKLSDAARELIPSFDDVPNSSALLKAETDISTGEDERDKAIERREQARRDMHKKGEEMLAIEKEMKERGCRR